MNRKQKPWVRNTPEKIEKPLFEGVFGQLNPRIQDAIRKDGYVNPTPIQEQCIPPILEGKDLIGIAQTGTGKTAAFALPLLQHMSKYYVKPEKWCPRALIMAPTRELADQISNSLKSYRRYLHLKHTVVFGGVKQRLQVKALKDGVDILVATPGRLLDLHNQGFVQFNAVEIFVIDEVDRMLDMGFIPDIKRVLEKLPKNRQTLFFSATMPPQVKHIADTMVQNPVCVSITPNKPTVDKINQKVLFVRQKNKEALLKEVLSSREVTKALIFTRMKYAANKLSERLQTAGVNCVAIHGNKSQVARTKALKGFRTGQYKVMVATDVAARGLDVDDISHVINYDMPDEAETYVHRIGRTARAGAAGDAISFCNSEDRTHLQAVESILGIPVPVDAEHPYHDEIASQKPVTTTRRFGQRRGRPGFKRKRPRNQIRR